MMKFQQTMMKNQQGNGMGMMRTPPPEVQKAIQLQMIGHTKGQFKNDEEIYAEFESI
jgi:hypothetical protein